MLSRRRSPISQRSITQTLFEIGTEIHTASISTGLLHYCCRTMYALLQVYCIFSMYNLGDVFTCSSYVKETDELYSAATTPPSSTVFNASLANTAPFFGAHFATNMALGSRPKSVQQGNEVENICTSITVNLGLGA